MAPKYSGVAHQELSVMLKAEIIPPETSMCSFFSSHHDKKDDKPRLFLDYKMLNQRIKANSFSLTRIRETFNDLTARVVCLYDASFLFWLLADQDE